MSDNTPPCTVERAPMQVIEKCLLTALTEESKVAILCNQQDLEDLLNALLNARIAVPMEVWERYQNLAQGIRQLLKEAFLKEKP